MKAVRGTTLVVIAAVAAIVVLALVGYYGGIIGNRVQANYNHRVVTSKLKQQVNTAAFMHVAYDHFFNLCAAVQSDEARLAAQETELSSAGSDDRDRILANIAGITSDRAEAVNEYNADARKQYTLGVFRAADLPYTLPADYKKGTHTSCVA